MSVERQQHMISVCESFIDPRPWAECSCGWKGPKHEEPVAAAANAAQDGREHQREAGEVEGSDSTRGPSPYITVHMTRKQGEALKHHLLAGPGSASLRPVLKHVEIALAQNQGDSL